MSICGCVCRSVRECVRECACVKCMCVLVCIGECVCLCVSLCERKRREVVLERDSARARNTGREGRVCACVFVRGYTMFDFTFQCRPWHSCLFSKAVICGLSCHLLVLGSHHHYDLHSRTEYSVQLQMSRCHRFTHRVDRVYWNFALIPQGTYFIKDPVCAFLPVPLLQTCGMRRQQKAADTHQGRAGCVFCPCACRRGASSSCFSQSSPSLG